jgi:hypothetical protein
MTGEPALFIPTLLYNSHLIALVHHEINDTVLFLYSDDTNNENTKNDIKRLITTQTNEIFCPLTAQWINCMSTYYIPHSNECGPCALLALHVLAIHSNPDSDILTHLMHPNLAQIASTWIATPLVTGKINDTNITHPFPTRQGEEDFTLMARSTPFNLINWPHTNSFSPEYDDISVSTTQSYPGHPNTKMTPSTDALSQKKRRS